MKIYKENTDNRCLDLLTALNSIKGVKTSSYSTDGYLPVYCVWFWMENKYIQNLHIISRCLDRNYGNLTNWNCSIQCFDTPKEGFSFFCLEGTPTVRKIKDGYSDNDTNRHDLEELHVQSKRITDDILYYLNRESYINYYGIER